MVIEKVKSTIMNNGLIQKGEHTVIGLSGGPDSVCLFHILYLLRQELEFTLHAVHINHKLRPGAADQDQGYVEELCTGLNIPLHTFVFDINKIAKERCISSEDAGRQMRYQAFYQVANSIHVEKGVNVKIAVAQNLNDQGETILMRIMRGTGTDGLSGIEYSRQGEGQSVIIRPLLDITRREIEEYCSENKLNPRIDLTNLEPIYTRNKIRLELIPYMQEHFNENIMMALNRLSKISKEDKEYMYQVVDGIMTEFAVKEDDLESGNSYIKIPVDVLLKQHTAIRHRLMIRLFESIGLTKDISWIHLENADKLLMEGKTSTSTDFARGYSIRISYHMAEFYKKEEEPELNIEYPIIINGTTHIHELNGLLEVTLLKRKEWENQDARGRTCSCCISYDSIEKSGSKLKLRTRRQGDYICPMGMKGKKKIQDLFVDEKIKKRERNRIPLLCLDNEVIWVIGARMSENYKILEKTKHVLLLEYSTII